MPDKYFFREGAVLSLTPSEADSKMCFRPAQWRASQVEKGLFLCGKTQLGYSKGFLLAWRVNAQTTPWVRWPAPAVPSCLLLPQLFSLFPPLKVSENHNSRKQGGQAPTHTHTHTHTHSKTSTYFWHTSCLQLIKPCFIYETVLMSPMMEH